MNERGNVFIIPREDKCSIDCFSGDVLMDHLDLIQEFCDKYNLGYKFDKSQYQEAPIVLALDGNIVIKTVIDAGNAIFYLPKYVTDRQSMWFFNNMDKFKNYSMIGAYVVDEKKDDYNIIYGLSNINKYINHSNILFSKEDNQSRLR